MVSEKMVDLACPMTNKELYIGVLELSSTYSNQNTNPADSGAPLRSTDLNSRVLTDIKISSEYFRQCSLLILRFSDNDYIRLTVANIFFR